MAHQAKEIMQGLWIGVGAVLMAAAFLLVVYFVIRARNSQKGGELATRLKEVSSIPRAELPDWKPNSRLLSELDPEIEVEGYRVRLPRGYHQMAIPIVPGEKFFDWSNGSRRVRWSTLRIRIVPHPAGEAAPAPEQSLQKHLDSIKFNVNNVSQIDVDKGLINGTIFHRARYSGTDRLLGRITYHFCYVTVDDGNSISIHGIDEEPNREESLAEAAARTFCKP